MRVVIANQAIKRLKRNEKFKEFKSFLKGNKSVEGIKAQNNCLKFINMLMEKVVLSSLSECEFILDPESILEEIKWLLMSMD